MKYLVVIFLLLCCSLNAKTWYVTPTGVGTGTGVTWANAGNAGDMTFVNDSTTAGDTVLFGTGEYPMTQPLVVISGTADTEDGRTIYACSTYAEADPTTGDYNLAILYRGTKITGWSSIGGGKYLAAFRGTKGVAGSEVALFAHHEMLLEQSSSAISAGEWWTDDNVAGADSTIVFLTGSVDPSTVMVVINTATSAGHVVDVASDNYVKIWGLGLMYGNNKTVKAGSGDSWGTGAADFITISHCKIGPCGGKYTSNPANIATSSQNALNDNWIIRADSILGTYALNGTSLQGTHGAGILVYSFNNSVIESSFVSGLHTHAAIFYKNDNTAPLETNAIIRYNDITSADGGANRGMRIWKRSRAFQIYGNILHDLGRALLFPFQTTDSSGNHQVFNNTFVNCDTVLWHRDDAESGTLPHDSSEFKYNVMYDSDWGAHLMDPTDSATGIVGPWIIDSNKYFWNSTNLYFHSNDAIDTTEWRTIGWDVQSTFALDTDHDFDNLAGKDYHRGAASGEMNRTVGGVTRTIFGYAENAAASGGGSNITGSVSVTGNVKIE